MDRTDGWIGKHDVNKTSETAYGKHPEINKREAVVRRERSVKEIRKEAIYFDLRLMRLSTSLARSSGDRREVVRIRCPNSSVDTPRLPLLPLACRLRPFVVCAGKENTPGPRDIGRPLAVVGPSWCGEVECERIDTAAGMTGGMRGPVMAGINIGDTGIGPNMP